MSDNILKIILEGDNSNLVGSVSQAKSSILSDLQSMSGGFSQLGHSMSSLAGPLAAFGSIAGAITGITEMVKATIELGDTLEKASEKTGISVEELGKLRYAAKMTDVDFDSLTRGLERLSKNMFESLVTPSSIAARAFQALGISVKDSSNHLKSANQIITEVADKFAHLKDGPAKTAIAMALFGRAGADLIPVLNLGGKGLEKLGIEGEKAGDVLSDKAAKAAAEMDDKMKQLKAGVEGVSLSVGSSLLPGLSGLFNAFKSSTGAGELLHLALGLLVLVINSVVGALLFIVQGFNTLATVALFAIKTVIGAVVALGTAIYDVLHGHLTKAKDDFVHFGDNVKSNWNSMLDSLYASSAATEKTFFAMGGQGEKETGTTAKKPNEKTGEAPDIMAQQALAKAKEKHAQTVKSLNEGLEREHILLTKGADAAYRFDLANKGLTKSEIDKFDAIHKSNEALKIKAEEEKKAVEAAKKAAEGANREALAQEKLYQSEKLNIIKQGRERDYQLQRDKIKDKYNNYLISGSEEIKLLQELNNKKYDEEKKDLERQIELNKARKGDQEKLLNDLLKLETKHDADTAASKKKLDAELMKSNGWAGAKKSLQDFVDSSKNLFKSFADVTTQVLNTMQNGIANVLQGMLTGQQSFADSMKALWSGIVSTVVGAIAQMIAQWLVAQLAQIVLGQTQGTVESSKQAASLDTATAETWAAYAGIPFAGPAIAIAQIATMDAAFMASKAANKGLTAFATGGLVDSPTLGLLGEAGREYLVPDKDMQSLLPSLVNQGAQIYKGLLSSNSYARQSLGKDFTPSNKSIVNNSTGHTFNISGVIGDKKVLGDYIKNIINNNTRMYGSAI